MHIIIKHTIQIIVLSLILPTFVDARPKTGTIIGIVVDSATNQPISGAATIVVGEKLGDKADTSGKFVIRKVPAGTYILKSTYIGYLTKTSQPVVIKADDTITVTMKLTISDFDFGKVTIVRSEVNFPDTVPPNPKPIKTVDELVKDIKKTVEESKQKVMLRGGDTSEVTYILNSSVNSNPWSGVEKQTPAKENLKKTHSDGKTGTITGIVTDSTTGKPIFGVSVLVIGKMIGAKTDTAGIYHIKKVPPGTYSLKITCIGYTTVQIDSVTVTLQETAITSMTSLHKNPADSGRTITIRGKVDPLDKFGGGRLDSTHLQPIKPDSTITTVDQLLAQVSGVVQNGKGQVFIRGSRAGEKAYILDGRGLNYPNNGFGEKVDAGKALAAIENQEPTGSITGLITDSASGMAIAGASVAILGTPTGAKTDSLGAFTIRGVHPGSYTLQMTSLGYFTVEIKHMVVADSTIGITQKLKKNIVDLCIPLKIITNPSDTDTTK